MIIPSITRPGSCRTEILRKGARRLIEQAIEAELEVLMERTAHLKDTQGRQRVVRNGHLPERQVQTGIRQGAARA